MSYNSLIIANYIIAQCNIKQLDISNLRLQKILYYVQGYFLKFYDERAFDSGIFNWPYGPVVPDVYFEYCVYGSNKLIIDDDLIEISSTKIKNKKHKKLINEIIEKCNNYTPGELVGLTHQEKPWKETSRSKEIPVLKIQNYFGTENPLNISK